ncbi:MAG: ABC transporter ATP-binding protein [Patulibacter sp.]
MHGQLGEPALQWRDVTVRYGHGAPAVANVTLSIEPGELVAMVGPNGAGKTSLMRAAAGLVARDGEIVIPGRARHDLAYVPQRRDIEHDFPITVGEVVAQGRRPHLRLAQRLRAADRSVIAWALEIVELRGLERAPLGTLSGGQLQRAMLARALAQEASVLLLDEPFNGVDGATVNSLIALLRRQAEAGTAIVVSTHDLALVRHHFQRCVLIDRRLVADGAPAAVLGGAALEHALGFMGGC